MRVAIVGAGGNAQYHLKFAKAYPRARIVGLADIDLPRAEAYAGRYGVERAFGSLAEMLKVARPDLVHVVTPPRTHFPIASDVLNAGCHALVEKPLGLNLAEAEALYGLAERRAVQLCPVHNHSFDPCVTRADNLIRSGGLGQVVSVESYYGLNTNIAAFRQYPRPNALPWHYDLPGGPYQDFLPHPLYLLLEYTGAPRTLTVTHRSTGVLPRGLPDEIRILVNGERSLGVATLSFAARPHLHFLRVYGTNGMVEVDINTMTTTVHSVSSLPRAAQKAAYNLDDSLQRTWSTCVNSMQFVRGKLQPYQGMMNLIHEFYQAIDAGSASPVSKASALTLVNTMDAVFEHFKYEPLRHEMLVSVRAQAAGPRILVTGGTGFVGRALVRRLVADGYNVRVLARKLAYVDAVHEMGAEVYWGDVGDLESFGAAMQACDQVVHLAAGTSGSEEDSRTSTIQGTRNLLELCRRHRPKRLVYVSTCSVYGVAGVTAHTRISETAELEPYPERRGTYAASKLQSDRYVAEFQKAGTVPTVMLRPGTIYGPGGQLYTPLMGFSVGSLYIVIGMGGFVLPAVYLDNLVDAILLSMQKDEALGEIFNVVDPERLTKRAYMNGVIRHVDPKARVLYFPYSAMYAITWMQERFFSLMKRRPVLSCYRLTSSQKSVVYDGGYIAQRLGWRSHVSAGAAMSMVVAAERSKRAPATSAAPSVTSLPAVGPQRPVEPRSAR